jgi:histone H3/H4
MTAYCLRDAIDQDVFRIDDEQYTDANFQAMSVDELQKVKLRIIKNISKITASIANKKIEENGQNWGADSINWYKSRRAALSINERVSAYVKNLISEHLRRRATGEYFMIQAKTVLPKELFERILKDAQQKSAGKTAIDDQ